MSAVQYDAEPTVSDFMSSDHFIRLILGPVGSGKTTGVMFECMRRAAEQRPGRDGVRRTRFAIVRNTLSQLKQTVLRDCETWLGPIMTFKSSESLITIQTGDIYSEWFLIPLAEPEDQKRLLSLQLTGVWVNEFIELDPSLLGPMAGRVGRYPSANDGGATWFGIVGDSNMPNVGSEWHRMLDVERPDKWGVFVQPGGLEDDAENLNYLTQTPLTLALPLGHPDRIAQGRKYYETLLTSQNKSWAKRYIHAQYGDDPDGTAVFGQTFVRKFHVTPGTRTQIGGDIENPIFEYTGGLTVVPGRMLIIGQDFGRNPCATINQMDHLGRFCTLEEIISVDMGLETHIQRKLRPALAQDRYKGLPIIVSGDPSGVAKGQMGEESSFDVLARYGFACQQAPSNAIDARLRAVETLLLGQIGGKGLYQIDEGRCPILIRAMMGLYRYGKTKQGQTKPVPEKTNPWSDIADSLQYAAFLANPMMQTAAAKVLARMHKARASAPPRRITARAWT